MVRQLWYHKRTWNTSTGCLAVRTQGGATGRRSEGRLMDPHSEALTANPGILIQRGESWPLQGALLWAATYNFMSTKLWKSLPFQFWYKSSHPQVAETQLLVTAVLWLFFQAQRSPPSRERRWFWETNTVASSGRSSGPSEPSQVTGYNHSWVFWRWELSLLCERLNWPLGTLP